MKNLVNHNLFEFEGIKLQMDKDHLLPLYLSKYPFYDRMILGISKYILDIDKKLILIDIGANIGDTVSLISKDTPGTFLCIEGDKGFAKDLEKNLNGIKNSTIYVEECFCSNEDKSDFPINFIKENGTARILPIDTKNPANVTLSNFKMLDTIVKENKLFFKTNIIKIDTDGFEINVLQGASKTLQHSKPCIYIEFTPQNYIEQKKDPHEFIEILVRAGYENALFFDNFGKPVKIVKLGNKEEINTLIHEIDNLNIYYFDILTYHKSKQDQYKDLFSKVLLYSIEIFNREENKNVTTKLQLENKITLDKDKLDEAYKEINLKTSHSKLLNEKVNTLKKNITELNKKIKLLREESETLNNNYNNQNLELCNVKKNIQNLEQDFIQIQNRYDNELNQIYNSKGWKLLTKVRFFLNSVLPSNSLQRKIASRLYTLFKYSFNYLKEKVFLFRDLHMILITQRKKRNINYKASKIAYIDHSYHIKTKSNEFLSDYLSKFYTIERIYDDSWNGNQQPNLSHIDKSYLAVIFFQVLPDKQTLEKINNDNIIFIPMYDGYAGCDFDFWNNYAHLKIINFSKTLHRRLKHWGLNSFFIQYFPKPKKSLELGDLNQVFFYNRVTNININTLEKLFKTNMKIHIHKSIDPNHTFIKPTLEQERKFSITYSNWFPKIEDKWNIVDKSSISIASRESEGIGLAFLEDMAMGKAVVAVNNPTMNEYIINKKTGYLFDLKNPKRLDLINLRQVQNNTRKFMINGYKKWERNKKKIIKFILQR